ncbi:MAG: hypothetical protein WC749_02560 [Dehalococcoidia bacterium]
MGWDLFKEKTVKCRKPHKCCLCGIEIKAGEPARYFSGIWEGVWTDGYECDYCQDLIKKLQHQNLLDTDEFSEDCYADASQDYLCGTCEKQVDMSSVSDEKWAEWENRRVDDNENCLVGAYLEQCRCEHRTERPVTP